jgi:hypothetical protein
LLEESFYLRKRGAAPGVDGVMRIDYQENLRGNLKELHERLQKGIIGPSQLSVYISQRQMEGRDL